MRYSVIVPAYNEEVLLPRMLRSVHEAMQEVEGSGEVLVVDNDSSDRTTEVARAAGALVVTEKRRQIARVRNRGAEAARGEILIFVDADTFPHPLHLREAIEALEAGAVAGGATLVFEPPPGLFMRPFAGFWNLISRTTRTAAGSFLFCRRADFHQAGGFPEDFYAGEEVELSRRLRALGRKNGRRLVVLKRRILTSGRKFEWFSSWKIFSTFLLLALCPPALKNARSCGLWYNRPGLASEEGTGQKRHDRREDPG